MSKNSDIEMTQPGMGKTGPVPVKPPSETMPVEQLQQQRKEGQAAPPANMTPYQLIPMQGAPAPSSVNPGPTPAAAGGAGK